jgi:hypothetical protein
MSTVELHVVISSALSLFVFVVIVFKLWPNQRIDMFRQNMFALRDELFDFAADGHIAFDEPAYILLRQLMNGFLRYAHNLTPFRTLMAFMKWKCTGQESLGAWTKSWGDALGQVKEPKIKAQLESFHSKASLLVLSQLVLSPGLLVLIVPPLIVLIVLLTQWTNLRNIYKDVRDKVPMSFLEEEAARS